MSSKKMTFFEQKNRKKHPASSKKYFYKTNKFSIFYIDKPKWLCYNIMARETERCPSGLRSWSWKPVTRKSQGFESLSLRHFIFRTCMNHVYEFYIFMKVTIWSSTWGWWRATNLSASGGWYSENVLAQRSKFIGVWSRNKFWAPPEGT